MIPVVVLLGVMWLLEILDAALPGDLDQFGIESRDVDGLTGVAASPFLHADFAHLMANTVPFLILGSIVALRNRVGSGRSSSPSRSSAGSRCGCSARPTR